MSDKPEEKQAKAKKPLKKTLREWAESFIVAIVLALAIKGLFFEIYKIPTSSMEPTLIGKLKGGDRIIVNKMKYRFKEPRRWDVFIFQSPQKGGKNLIKRVTGLPGEKLTIIDGDIYVNDKTVPEEKPAVVQEAVYIQTEKIGFEDDTWQYRFAPRGFKPSITGSPGAQVLDIDVPGQGLLEYRRGISNFYVRQGSVQARCTHSYRGEWFPLPEASTLNSLVPCPGCDDYLDLQELDDREIRVQRSLDSAQYTLSRSGFSAVGDLRVSFDIQVDGQSGYLACLITEHNREYQFRIAAIGSGSPSRLTIRDRDTRRILAEDTLPFQFYAGFRGRLTFENCDNRESLAVNGERVYSRVFDWGRERDYIQRRARLVLAFSKFKGKLDNLDLFRDIHYTNIFDMAPAGEYAIDPANPLQLGETEYFAMGDNSTNSNDSRYFGPVPSPNVMGNAVMVFPWFWNNRWKLIY